MILKLFFFISLILGANARTLVSEPIDTSVIWHAHETENISEELMLKSNLCFILAQNKSLAGLAFINLENKQSHKAFQLITNNPNFRSIVGSPALRTYKSFSDKMEMFAHILPNGRFVCDKSVETLIKEAFFFKEMRAFILKKITTFQESLDNIQAADYLKNSKKYHDIALKVCSGDFRSLNFVVNSLPTSLIDVAAKMVSGKNCEAAVKDDILKIVTPYDNPLTATEDHSTLEGTSIFLAEQLIPNQDFESHVLYKSLLQVNEIESLNPHYNLYEAIGSYLDLSRLNTIRLINLANHNHGLEFFMTNAIIDLSQDDTSALINVKEAFASLNHLYKLVNVHQKERKKVSNALEDQSERPYHYWGGAMLSCELIKKGYSPFIAAYISGKLGEAYETNTSDLNSNLAKLGMYEDIKLHEKGAVFGKKVCSF